MTGFWSWFIIILTVLMIVGSFMLLTMTSKRKPGAGETTGHVWDEDLAEYNNPLPRWWLWLFYITLFFSIAYMWFFPGMGSFKGSLGWSQVGQYEAEVAAREEEYHAFYARFADMDIAEIARQPDAMQAANNIFGNHCAQCHGSAGYGAKGFPNLTDGSWLYGGSPEVILTSIQNGRNGVMPPHLPILGEQGVEEVVNYVMHLSGQDVPEELVAAGQARFAVCSACHGMDGKGNQALGAPNLTDDIWIYGGDRATITETVVLGRQNMMPAQLPRLGEDRTRIMAAYVMKISGQVSD